MSRLRASHTLVGAGRRCEGFKYFLPTFSSFRLGNPRRACRLCRNETRTRPLQADPGRTCSFVRFAPLTVLAPIFAFHAISF